MAKLPRPAFHPGGGNFAGPPRDLIGDMDFASPGRRGQSIKAASNPS